MSKKLTMRKPPNKLIHSIADKALISIYPLETDQPLSSPRRIMKYVLIWCSSGSLLVKVDEQEFKMTRNSVITITSGQIHKIIAHKKAQGFVLEFTYDFFCKDDNDIELIFHNSLFCHFAMNEPTHYIDFSHDSSIVVHE